MMMHLPQIILQKFLYLLWGALEASSAARGRSSVSLTEQSYERTNTVALLQNHAKNIVASATFISGSANEGTVMLMLVCPVNGKHFRCASLRCSCKTNS